MRCIELRIYICVSMCSTLLKCADARERDNQPVNVSYRQVEPSPPLSRAEIKVQLIKPVLYVDPEEGFVKIISVGILTYAGMKTSF